MADITADPSAQPLALGGDSNNTAQATLTTMAAPASPTPTEATRPGQPQRPRQKRPRRRAVCPEPGSLYDILRENCGRSLFVLPILWTDIHTRLLRSEFNANDPILDAIHLAPLASSSSTEGARSQASRSSADEALSMDLTSLLSPHDTRPFSKSRAIKNVLSSLYQTPFSRPKSNSDLDIHFGDRVHRKAVRIPVLWSSPSSAGTSFDSAVTRVASSSFGHAASSAREHNDFRGPSFTHNSSSVAGSQGTPLDGPTVAYVNRSHLTMIRQNLFRIIPGPANGDVGNTPVSNLQCLRSKLLMPTDRDRDPYLMGVFLGMAQAHFYEAAPSRVASQVMWWNSAQRNCRMLPVAEFRDVKLRVVTHDDETSDFMVYTTTVTAELLKKFAEPTKNPVASAEKEMAAGMKIEYTRVPVWPILGLRARLGRALGKDLVGDTDESVDEGDECDDKTENNDDAEKSEMDKSDKAETSDKADATDPANTTDNTDKSAAEKTRADLLPQDRGTRVDTLKRKRSERKSYADVLSGAKSAKDDSGGSGNTKGSSATSPVASPMSPRTKRRQTRSLSSSLAVF